MGLRDYSVCDHLFGTYFWCGSGFWVTQSAAIYFGTTDCGNSRDTDSPGFGFFALLTLCSTLLASLSPLLLTTRTNSSD